MPSFTSPVVGMHFYPPAKEVMEELLQIQCYPLIVEREQENAYDENAIKVFAEFEPESESVPEGFPEHLRNFTNEACEARGIDQINDTRIWLGYIARDHAAMIAPLMDQGMEISSSYLSRDERGKPVINLIFSRNPPRAIEKDTGERDGEALPK